MNQVADTISINHLAPHTGLVHALSVAPVSTTATIPYALQKFCTGSTTPDDVKEWLAQAFKIEARLPRVGPRGYASVQITPLVDKESARSKAITSLPPTADDMLHWQTAMSWFRLFDRDEAEMLKLKFRGIRQKQIAMRIGMTESTVCRRIQSFLQIIADHLNSCPADALEVPVKWKGEH